MTKTAKILILISLSAATAKADTYPGNASEKKTPFSLSDTYLTCTTRLSDSRPVPGEALYSWNPNSDAKYIILKQHGTGAGGGLVYKVQTNPRYGEKVIRLLKIFPYQKRSKRQRKILKSGVSLREANRERLNVCMMSEFNKQISERITTRDINPTVFPEFEMMGFTKIASHSRKVPFLVTDYVSGRPLSEYKFSEDKRYDIDTRGNAAYSVFLQLLSALKDAHDGLSFRHFDLHPGNILISDEVWSRGSFLNINDEYGNSLSFDLSGTPKAKIIDLGTSEIGAGTKGAISRTDPKFLNRKITMALGLRAAQGVVEHCWRKKSVALMNPDLSMWYIAANYIIDSEAPFSGWHAGTIKCTNYRTCLDGFLENAPVGSLELSYENPSWSSDNSWSEGAEGSPGGSSMPFPGPLPAKLKEYDTHDAWRNSLPATAL